MLTKVTEMKSFHHSKFSYNAASLTFVTEASDLGIPGGLAPDKFCLQGREDGVGFYPIKTVRDNEGDIISWDYRGVHNNVVYTARIMND